MTFAYNVWLACNRAAKAPAIVEWAKADPELYELYLWVEELRREDIRNGN